MIPKSKVTEEEEAVRTSNPALKTTVSAGTFRACIMSALAGSKAELSIVFST